MLSIYIEYNKCKSCQKYASLSCGVYNKKNSFVDHLNLSII